MKEEISPLKLGEIPCFEKTDGKASGFIFPSHFSDFARAFAGRRCGKMLRNVEGCLASACGAGVPAL
jgi:hypothetical protein